MMECKFIFQFFSLVIKTKVVQNVNRMSERHAGRQTERQNDFSAQLSKQKLFRMSTGCQKDRKTGQQRDRKTEILFSLVIKTKVVKNVNKKDKTESHQARIAGQLKTSLLFLHHCHLYL